MYMYIEMQVMIFGGQKLFCNQCENCTVHILIWNCWFTVHVHWNAGPDYIGAVWSLLLFYLQERLMGHLGVVLYEYLGEEYPEVLGSILGALKGIVNVIGMTKMTPPIKDLLPRLTPILKNRSVQKSLFHSCKMYYFTAVLSIIKKHL